MSQTLKTLQSRIKDINSQIETETDLLAELSLKVKFSPLLSHLRVNRIDNRKTIPLHLPSLVHLHSWIL
jgi:hypothetical protein